MGKRKKPIIRNYNNPKGLVNSGQVNDEKKIYINFTDYPKWTSTVVVGTFTNKLKDKAEALRHFFFILNELLKYIQENEKDILDHKISHCHPIKDSNSNYNELSKKIIETIHGRPLGDEDAHLWQLGLPTEEIRIVGMFVDKTFYPLFVDHHHLLYPSKKYNQKDYKHYNFDSNDISKCSN